MAASAANLYAVARVAIFLSSFAMVSGGNRQHGPETQTQHFRPRNAIEHRLEPYVNRKTWPDSIRNTSPAVAVDRQRATLTVTFRYAQEGEPEVRIPTHALGWP